MFRKRLFFTLLSLSTGLTAWSAPCPYPEANMEINVKGNDPIIKTLLGPPSTEIFVVPAGNGCFRHHTTGSIYWNRDAGTHYVLGAIRQKWSVLGWEKSFLGFPVTDETPTPDGVGRFNHFQGGSIYWHPSHGAFEVHGDIRHLWSQLQWERGFLGYPITDETKTPDGIGRFNHFQGGSIYWKPNLGPHFILGTIRHYWASQGWERNPKFGYPISNELSTSPGSVNRYTDFENGVIYWKQANNTAYELVAFPHASRSKEDLEIEAQKKVAELMAPVAHQAYIAKSPTITEVGDYRRNGFNDVLNRQIKLSFRVKYKAAFLGIDGALPDPHTDLDLWLSLEKRVTRAGTEMIMTLTHGKLHTYVPAPTRVFIAPETINKKLNDDVLKNVVNRPQVLAVIPPQLNILSVKVSREGHLQTFIEPL